MISPMTCPVCSKPIHDSEERAAAPFCSERCKKVDFFRWWDGQYAIVENIPADLTDQLQAELGEPDQSVSEDPHDFPPQ